MSLIVFILVLVAAYLGSRLAKLTVELEALSRRLAELERRQYQQERERELRVASAAATASAAPPTLVAAEVPPWTEPEPSVIPPPLALPPLIQPTPGFQRPTDWNESTEPAHPPIPPLAASAEPEARSWPSSTPRRPALKINWEQFMGVKLFAWIGGFALFLGVAFFIKYSFDRNLIPPALRAAIGFVIGAALLVGGIFMKRRELAVTSHTLCATGVVVLYAVTFACHSVYHFPLFNAWVTFALMAGITATAFTLAVQLDALVVAILGLVGGFLTPVLLATGQDNPAGLFSYIALLDLGLMAVAFRRRWHFLIALSALGTVLMQVGWAISFFAPEKVFIAMTIFLGFDLLFLLAFVAGEQLDQANPWLTSSAAALPTVTLGFAGALLSYATLGARPGVVFTYVLGADLCLLAMVLLRPTLEHVHLAAGGAAFLLLAGWTVNYVTPALLFWALGLYLVFALLHSLFPVLATRRHPGSMGARWGCVFPPLAIVLTCIPLLQLSTTSLFIWPAVLLMDVLAIGLAVVTTSVTVIVVVLVLTLVATGFWVLRLPTDLGDLSTALALIGGFAVFFFVIGWWASRRILARVSSAAGPEDWVDEGMVGLFPGGGPAAIAAQVPALAAILPFVLLIVLSVRLPLLNPTPIFGMAMVFVGLLLGASLVTRIDALAPVALACVFLLQSVWHADHFASERAVTPLLWHFAFLGVFLAFPFVFRRRLETQLLPWCAAALAAPLHFFLIYSSVSRAYPNDIMGLLPAAFALPMFMALGYVHRRFEEGAPLRLALLAWFGGVALFFVTLIIPIQFERQWITLGWALEGLALIALFWRVPHPGLRATGVVLLMIAFARLALNPAVLDYHRSASFRVFNWYLYSYGVVTICLMLAARLLAPPRQLVWNRNFPPVLYTLGTVLAFLLLNIEIADYFAEGDTLTFQFSGNFARDMSYSIGWALFALTLLSVGIWKRLTAPRYAAIGLLVVTLLKLFIHDLSQLDQLYRIGAFVFVALILMFASFLYQRFVAFDTKPGKAERG